MLKSNSHRIDRFDFVGQSLWVESVEQDEVVEAVALVAPSDQVTITVAAASNDRDYVQGRTWGLYGDQTTPTNLYGSQAGEAWAAGHIGSMKVAIGVIDSGIDYLHPDLYANIWLNQGEIPFSIRSLLTDTDGDAIITFRDLNGPTNGGLVSDLNGNGRIDGGDLLADSRWANGVDEAGNGYLDDLIGWDFVNNDNNPLDDHGHGTHVGGTIGAMGGNGIGVAGVAWNVQLVPLKFLGADGKGTEAGAIGAIDYFTTARLSNPGVDFAATNNSWSNAPNSANLLAAITRGAQADILFVAAAGNGAADTDARPFYPSAFTTQATAGYDAVVAVGALVQDGTLAAYSNYGLTSVDLAAPGSAILSTVRGGGYGNLSGTSMAAPHVSGAVALFSAANPGYSAAQIRAELLGSTAATASVTGKTVTGGRLDVAEFLTVASSVPTIYGTAGNDTIRGTTANERILGVAASGDNPGKNSVDKLYGGGGDDVFVLGDSRGIFYDDDAAGVGRVDYAQIMDWARGDLIQLAGQASDYHLKLGTYNGLSGTWILFDSNDDGLWNAPDEFIGHVVGMNQVRPDAFVYG